ncbi:7-cyano-7-deazaguanine synthase [Candidatus Bathyarchaeota archaeon]|nr:7-cyano-7-deazaguanine synthase [Candidatus Bathyarchaeota archaeon]
MVAAEGKRPKALILISGGLDSMVAARLLLDQNIDVEALHFRTPFSEQNEEFVEKFCRDIGIKLHKIVLKKEYLKIVLAPKHGYGSEMNPCVDCRILELKKAKKVAEKIEADFIATGEVLGERPFSQNKDMMLHIEKEAGLEGKVLRPLSAKLLPETEAERKGYVNRERLYAIKGRRRTHQMTLAKELGIFKYPNPAGGCLLTEPRFADRLKEHIKNEKKLTILDVELLKAGRHFRIGKTKVIVGRNERENYRLSFLCSKNKNLAMLEVNEYMGPTTVIVGKHDVETLQTVAAITVRYSDAPKDTLVSLKYDGKNKRAILNAYAMPDSELRKYII